MHLGRELVRVINPLEPRKEGSGGEVTANEPSYALLELGVCVSLYITHNSFTIQPWPLLTSAQLLNSNLFGNAMLKRT